MDHELKDKLLKQLGMAVLNMLERDEEWNDDTIDNIGMAAIDLGLAYVDEETKLFKKNKFLIALPIFRGDKGLNH